MKILFYLLLFANIAFAQKSKPEDFGFRHLQTVFKGDTVDILVKSKSGEESAKKPVFLFCQGSLPQPLIKTDGERTYGVFPFKIDSLLIDYHLVIISKPAIPVIAEAKTLSNNFTYIDPKTGKYPAAFSDKNLPDYYVDRNLHVIDFLQKQPFIDNKKLVIAGHSEGSSVAAKLATKSDKVTHLIYASGNPLGRIMDMINRSRAVETDTDSTRFGEYEFDYWEYVVNNKESMDASNGDTNKATYDFSYPSIRYLEKLTIPVLVCYGTKDSSAPFNDYLRVEILRQQKTNFTFKAYIGLEHNFFPLTPEGKPNYEVFNWNKVVNDWREWAK